MTRYVEANPRSRLLFFLALIALGALALLADRVDELLPPLSNNPDEMADQILTRHIIAASLNTLFFVALTLKVLHDTRRMIASGQWPPPGMKVPFRQPIREIKNPRYAWFLFVVSVFGYSILIGIPWFKYFNKRAYLEERRVSSTYGPQQGTPTDRPRPAGSADR